MNIDLLLDLYVVAVGLVVGSYLNVVIHRLPRRQSTVLPHSRCPHCGERVRARDNIPVVSFLLLQGRCRSCSEPISWRYPIVEATTTILFLAAFELYGASPRGLAVVVFGSLLIVLAAIDVEHYLLPDLITIPFTVIALAASPWLPWIRWQDALIGTLAGGGGLWLLARAWYLLRREEGLGLGDAKMLALVGAFLGWQGAIVTLFLSSLLGAVVGLVIIVAGDGTLKTRLPFGFFLAIGALAALFAGPQLVSAYTELL